MKYIYSRVSTADQNVEQQSKLLEKQYLPDKVFEDKFSGKSLDREKLIELMELVQSGDEIICYDVSRLSRNTKDLLSLVENLTTRNVKLVIHTLGGVDITSPSGKMILTVLASVAEMQRTEMLEKQAIGIARAKLEGKYKGKQITPEMIEKVKRTNSLINENKLKIKDAIKITGVSIASFYRLRYQY